MDGHVNVVKLLLSHGADPTIRNSDGKTPADMVEVDDVNRQVILEALENTKQGIWIVYILYYVMMTINSYINIITSYH